MTKTARMFAPWPRGDKYKVDFLSHVVRPGETVRLADRDTGAPKGFRPDKGKVAENFEAGIVREIEDGKDLMATARTHGVLVVFQGLDGAGKDGIIKNAFRINPDKVRVAAFKKPTPAEAKEHFLARIKRQTPRSGEFVVFNRSHYEDVLVPVVNGALTREHTLKRFGEIRAFETSLARAGILLVKFFLNLSHEEQGERLRDRLADPLKRHKAAPSDWQNRERWDAYQQAFNDMLSHTSFAFAPWLVVPADAKWYRDLFVAAAVRALLKARESEWTKSVIAIGNAKKRETERYLRGRDPMGKIAFR